MRMTDPPDITSFVLYGCTASAQLIMPTYLLMLRSDSRNCPKAIWISISMVTVVYTFANIAYFTTVSREEVLSGAAVAVVSITDHIMKNEI